MAKRKHQPTTPGQSFAIQPGSYLIIDTSTARGGITYQRDKDAERAWRAMGVQQDLHTRKRIDHKVLVKDGQNIVQSDVRCILRNYCAQTSLGWLAPKAALPAMQAAFDGLASKVRAFNESAAIAGSAIRVSVGFVPVELTVDNVAAARHIAHTIATVCAELRDALRAGDRGKLALLFRRAKNLDRLSTGVQKFSVIAAIECAKEARTALNAAVKENDQADLTKVGAKLDLEAIEACIDMFADFDDAADSRAA